MGPVEDFTCPDKDRRGGAKARPCRRRPRPRCCLLKGCERLFRPRHAAQRYCSSECGQAARRWSRWKAQQSYRATAAGKEKRNGQSRRYRERVKSRQQTAPEETAAKPARVISPNFFRLLLRPARLLRRLRATTSLSGAALLFARMPARLGTSPATRASLAARNAAQASDLIHCRRS